MPANLCGLLLKCSQFVSLCASPASPHIVFLSHTFVLLSNWLSKNNPSPSCFTQFVINFLTSTLAKFLTPPLFAPTTEVGGEDSPSVGEGRGNNSTFSLSLTASDSGEALEMVVIDNELNPISPFSSPSSSFSSGAHTDCPLPRPSILFQRKC